MRGRASRILFGAALLALVLVALYAAAGLLIVPRLAERALADVATRIGGTATSGRLAFNPFTFAAEAHDVALTGADGQPLAQFARAAIDLEATSAFASAWRIRSVTLQGARLAVVVDERGRSNLDDALERLRRDTAPSPAAAQPPALRIDSLVIEDAHLRYVDRRLKNAAPLAIGPLALTIDELSTLADAEARYRMTAGLPAGARFSAAGTLRLQPLTADGTVALDAFQAAPWWPWLGNGLTLAVPRGTAAAHARYRVARTDHGLAFVVSEGRLQLRGLTLTRSSDPAPLLTLEDGTADGVRYDHGTRRLDVASVKLARGSFLGALDGEGRFNWGQLVARRDQPSPHGAPWQARLAHVLLDGIAVRYRDATRLQPLAIDVERGHAIFALHLAGGADATNTTVENLQLDLAGLAAGGEGAREPLLALDRVHVAGARIATGERVLAADELRIQGGRAELIRDADGRIPLAAAFAAARPTPPASSPAWQFRLGSATASGVRAVVGDATYQPVLRYDVELAQLRLKNAAGGAEPLAYDVQLKAAQGGMLNASGTLAQDYTRSAARLDLKGLALQPLQPLLSRHTTLLLRTGTLDANGAVAYARDGKPSLKITGNAAIDGLLLDEADRREPFLRWKRLAVEQIAYTLAPDRLDVKDVMIDAPETAIAISREREVNLARVVKPAAATTDASTVATRPPLSARIGRVRVQNGTLDFADFSLVLPFSTRVTRVNGSMLGASTDPDSRAELKIAGVIEPTGYASAEGGINLRAPKTFTDISARFQNVEMPPLSPYTATFAGRKIDGGHLWLDLDYKIVDQQLAGANRILLENVELGERVAAPNAMDLPLDLALALLKDSQGRIDMTIPVRGDVGNPQFDYGALIRDAIAAALGRIVTAPFRALASLFGGADAEEAGRVRFAAGSTRLFPPERESIARVAKALAARPQLKIIVQATYDAARDGDRLRRQPVRRELAATLGTPVKPGEDPGPVPFSDAPTQQGIEKLYVARAGREALRRFAAEHAERRTAEAPGSEADRRRLYYEALYEQLVAAEPLADTALQTLAAERAKVIYAALAEAGVPDNRITMSEIAAADGSNPRPGVESQLALGVR